MKVFYCKFI